MDLTDKFIVELDLVGYSRICKPLEQQIDARVINELNEQILAFIRAGVKATGKSWPDVVYLTTGDGAILGFDAAEQVYLFAAAVNGATREHNKNRDKPAKRYFRIGAAYGEIALERSDSGWKFAGTTVSRAVRLEAAASIGCMLIDQDTFDKMPAQFATRFNREIRVRGKGDEIFTAHLCRFLPIDEAREVEDADNRQAELATKLPKAHPVCDQDLETVRKNNFEMMCQLHSGKLIDLAILLEIPDYEQPPPNDTPGDRARSICDWATRHNKDRDLCIELTTSKEPLAPPDQPSHNYPSPFGYGKPIDPVTPSVFYTRLLQSIKATTGTLSLMYLPPDRLPYPAFKKYLTGVDKLIASNKRWIRRMVVINDVHKMKLVITDLRRFRDKQSFSVALVDRSCIVSDEERKYPLPANVQIIGDDEVYYVDPVHGCHQAYEAQAISLIIRDRDFAKVFTSYYDAFWKKCATLKDMDGVHKTPLVDLLEYLRTDTNGDECDRLRALLDEL